MQQVLIHQNLLKRLIYDDDDDDDNDDDELFCGMVDQRKAFGLISSWNHCQRFTPS